MTPHEWKVLRFICEVLAKQHPDEMVRKMAMSYHTNLLLESNMLAEERKQEILAEEQDRAIRDSEEAIAAEKALAARRAPRIEIWIGLALITWIFLRIVFNFFAR